MAGAYWSATATGHRWPCWSRWPVPTWSAGWCSPPGLPPQRLGARCDRPGPGNHRLLRRDHGAVSPDGPDAFPALAAKLHRMHSQEPTLTVADLAGYPGPSWSWSVTMRTRSPWSTPWPCARGCRSPSWRSSPAPATVSGRRAQALQPPGRRLPHRGHRRRRPMIAASGGASSSSTTPTSMPGTSRHWLQRVRTDLGNRGAWMLRRDQATGPSSSPCRCGTQLSRSAFAGDDIRPPSSTRRRAVPHRQSR